MPTPPTESSPSVHSLKHLEHELESLRKENFDFKLRIFHLEERLAKIQGTSHQEAVESVDAVIRLEEVETELQSRDKLLDKAHEAIENLQKKISSITNDNEHLSAQLKTQISASTELSEENTRLQTKVDSLLGDNQSLTSSVSSLKNQLSTVTSETRQKHQNDIHKLERDFYSLKDQLEAAREAKQSYKQKCTHLVTTINKMKEEHQRNDSTGMINDLKRKNGDLKSNLIGIEKQYQELLSRFEQYQRTAAHEYEQLDSEKAKLAENNRLLSFEIRDRQSKFQSLSKHLGSYKSENRQLRQQLEEARQRLQESSRKKLETIDFRSTKPLIQSASRSPTRSPTKSPSRSPSYRSRSLSVPKFELADESRISSFSIDSDDDDDWNLSQIRLDKSLRQLNMIRDSASKSSSLNGGIFEI
ncbi:hypothetical protein GEMRC1_007462 [Eukaryota sp. GEM-RC1]